MGASQKHHRQPRSAIPTAIIGNRGITAIQRPFSQGDDDDEATLLFPLHGHRVSQEVYRVGESETTFGSPPSSERLVYKCPDHGYHLWSVEKNLLYGYGSPDADLERIKDRMKIKWKWLHA
jgi:hypothetical protein